MSTAADGINAALAAALVILIAVIGLRAWRRSRTSPEEKERQRRLMLWSTGKMGEAYLVDMHDDLLIYSYAVRGVEYTASQDISRLKAYLPADLAWPGHLSVKYDPRNPANSIVVSEVWTGLQSGSTTAATSVPRLSPGE